MNITELIEEAEQAPKVLDNYAFVRGENDLVDFLARSRTLLPLLVAVIKNQQRQIEMLNGTVIDYSALNLLAAELEDVKP